MYIIIHKTIYKKILTESYAYTRTHTHSHTSLADNVGMNFKLIVVFKHLLPYSCIGSLRGVGRWVKIKDKIKLNNFP